MPIRRPPKWPLDHEPDAVFDARDRAQMTQQQLADQCGVSRSLIAEIELGSRNARPELIAKLAAALGCARTDLEHKHESEATPSADVDVQQVRGEERASTDELPELRRELT